MKRSALTEIWGIWGIISCAILSCAHHGKRSSGHTVTMKRISEENGNQRCYLRQLTMCTGVKNERRKKRWKLIDSGCWVPSRNQLFRFQTNVILAPNGSKWGAWTRMEPAPCWWITPVVLGDPDRPDDLLHRVIREVRFRTSAGRGQTLSKSTWQVNNLSIITGWLQPIRSTVGELYHQRSQRVDRTLPEVSLGTSENTVSIEERLQCPCLLFFQCNKLTWLIL